MERTARPLLAKVSALTTSHFERLVERGDNLMARMEAKEDALKQLTDDLKRTTAKSRQSHGMVLGTALPQHGQALQLVDRTRKANELTPSASPILPAVKLSKNDSMAGNPDKVAILYLPGPNSSQELANRRVFGLAQYEGKLTPAASPQETSEEKLENVLACGKTESVADMTAPAFELGRMQRGHRGNNDNIIARPEPAVVKSLEDGLTAANKTEYTVISHGAMYADLLNRYTEVKVAEDKLSSNNRHTRELVTLASELIDVEEDMDDCEEIYEHLCRLSEDAPEDEQN